MLIHSQTYTHTHTRKRSFTYVNIYAFQFICKLLKFSICTYSPTGVLSIAHFWMYMRLCVCACCIHSLITGDSFRLNKRLYILTCPSRHVHKCICVCVCVCESKLPGHCWLKSEFLRAAYSANSFGFSDCITDFRLYLLPLWLLITKAAAYRYISLNGFSQFLFQWLQVKIFV